MSSLFWLEYERSIRGSQIEAEEERFRLTEIAKERCPDKMPRT